MESLKIVCLFRLINCSFRCFTRFYGFVKEGKNITGFIYEFMSNGSLGSNRK